MTDKSIRNYTGKHATIAWDKKLCIHAGDCIRADGDLFELGRKPWCSPDTSNNEDILDIVSRCPSGSLSVVFTDSDKAELAPIQNTITVVYDGPLQIKGELQIEGVAEDDSAGLMFRASLCRCGLSKNKPYCDNSHKQSGFNDDGAVNNPGTPLEENGGPLAITLRENGPLFISGNVRIVAASGTTEWQGTKTALCRCGHSKNKPFCDGTHRSEQWQAD
ncbi:CDGSH iron-sulfur domain-containing protein [Granulosicoccus antarcticus]|uniref:Iron-binding zinc finger CDGSH type domain-containing protein n=1 Tax=Granulosicoccus antarcticus IMCC3135 TaxID=1192854 RepID=A0A2Z2NWH5_9GAMM|nr:CDGSH iron-sulfur domain-containing protein [Granulosicoccus antarcticus]ASJ74845.1 hypothetical protein IMCC3135_23880 [Granulosicoccus antarcticus IMCC3135]